MIYVDLDDNWIYSLQPELDLYGYENPPYFYPPSPTGAHITLLPSAIAEDRGRLFWTGRLSLSRLHSSKLIDPLIKNTTFYNQSNERCSRYLINLLSFKHYHPKKARYQ